MGKALFGALCGLGGQFVLDDEEYAKDKERQRIADEKQLKSKSASLNGVSLASLVGRRPKSGSKWVRLMLNRFPHEGAT